MFAMISSRLELADTQVLDLFAGTGALGIEALSRGARSCRFVESDRRAAELIRTNLQELGIADRARVTSRDALKWIEESDERYDLVLADPPYASAVFDRLVERVVAVLMPAGMLALEHPGHLLIAPPMSLEVIAARTFGGTAVTLLRPADPKSKCLEERG
jgi:16S rRNA (guanine966-N2)-methyltransferase